MVSCAFESLIRIKGSEPAGGILVRCSFFALVQWAAPDAERWAASDKENLISHYSDTNRRVNSNKPHRTLKVLLILGVSFVFLLLLCGVIFLKPIFYPAKVTLPPVEKLSRIEVETDYTDPIVISEPEKLRLVEDFINHYPDEWYAPPLVPGLAAKLDFSLYSDDELIELFGVSENYTTRNYRRLVQNIPEEEIQDFIAELSPILEEALYPVIPTAPTEIESLPYWEKKLSELEGGSSSEEINRFLIDNNIATTAVYPNSFINVNLYVVNDGDYVDTVIAGQLVLDENNNLDGTRFFGYELSEKAEFKKLAY